MRNGYTPPPGYDGSRFVRNRDRVTAIGDGDYTLSVGGIPRSGYREDQKLRSDMRDDAGARRTRGGYRTPHRSTSGSGEEERAVVTAEHAPGLPLHHVPGAALQRVEQERAKAASARPYTASAQRLIPETRCEQVHARYAKMRMRPRPAAENARNTKTACIRARYVRTI